MGLPNLYGTDLLGNEVTPPNRGRLSERFVVPPFSVLSARDGFWQKRKKMWKRLGLKSDAGRNAPTAGSTTVSHRDKKTGKLIQGGLVSDTDSSIFDPVLCELAYRWFCPVGGTVVDPFAGGSVRGVVAEMLGRKYWGCDLRAEQTAANYATAEEIVPGHNITWATGDATTALRDAPMGDFLLSCPPYADLEKYSDDPADLSNMEYADFLAAYRKIINRAARRLKQDRFAVWVVSEIRDRKTGNYRGFVPDTIQAFRDAGFDYHNEAVLIRAVGSLSLRAGRFFQSTRRFGRGHETVLVFVKGDPRVAAALCENMVNK